MPPAIATESIGQSARQTEKGAKSADTARLSEELFSLLTAEGSKPDDDVVMEKIEELEVRTALHAVVDGS